MSLSEEDSDLLEDPGWGEMAKKLVKNSENKNFKKDDPLSDLAQKSQTKSSTNLKKKVSKTLNKKFQKKLVPKKLKPKK